MIGQKIGLEYLLPVAIKVLEKEPFVEADYYEGDLFLNVLRIGDDYWSSNQEQKEIVRKIFKDNLDSFKELDTDIQEDLYEAYEKL